jgi:cytochrome c553
LFEAIGRRAFVVGDKPYSAELVARARGGLCVAPIALNTNRCPSDLSESRSWGRFSRGSAVSRMLVKRPTRRAIWRQSGECAMVTLRYIAITAAACAAASLALADEKPGPGSEAYKPRLNSIMILTQLGHFKLWYAGAVQNWPLANYELEQIRASIDLSKTLYSDSAKSNMDTMKPAANDLDKAIQAKDAAKFTSAFAKLTTACNNCHEATGFGFIKIRVPRLSPIETSPFSDESFSGK